MTDNETRRRAFDAVIEDYDERELEKCVDFAKHRFVSIERDAQTVNRYVKGHASLRGACGYLSLATEEGEPYVPEQVVDLDTGKSYELELFAFVAPTDVDPAAVMMPRPALRAAYEHLRRDGEDDPTLAQAVAAIKQAIDRR